MVTFPKPKLFSQLWVLLLTGAISTSPNFFKTKNVTTMCFINETKKNPKNKGNKTIKTKKQKTKQKTKILTIFTFWLNDWA